MARFTTPDSAQDICAGQIDSMAMWCDRIMSQAEPQVLSRDQLTERLADYVMPGPAHRVAAALSLSGHALRAGQLHIAAAAIDRLGIADPVVP